MHHGRLLRTPTAALVATAVAVVALDQLTKHWALDALADGHVIDLVWTLRFNLVFNEGAAFSLVRGAGPLLAVLALVVVVFIVRAHRGVGSVRVSIALGFVVGGAVGNLIDRLLRSGEGFLGGRVVDFIDLQWWPVFNVADMAIVIGGILIVLFSAIGDLHRTSDGSPPSTQPVEEG